MARIVYVPKKFTPAHRVIIDSANDICEEYDQQGLSLTLRQLYYQFVARGLLPNRQEEYKRLGGIVNDARLAGELDWEYLVDRTRNLVAPATWASPDAILKASATSYTPDLWRDQHHRIEVWIEKDAGIGVIEAVCQDNQVPFFSCRGYTSSSELWAAAQRVGNHLVNGNRVTVLHVGDHDPSGLDMTRDIKERLALFLTNDWNRSPHFRSRASRYFDTVGLNNKIREDMRETIRETGGEIGNGELPWRVRRIALNYDQVQQYNPPPNPAKTTDSRFVKYEEETGLHQSWELDALDPVVLQTLINDEIDNARDDDKWGDVIEEQERDQRILQHLSDNWTEIRETFGDAS
jgi:hypothetical protein